LSSFDSDLNLEAAKEPAPDGPGSFAEQAQRILGNLKIALSRVVDSIPGAAISRPTELARALALDNGLAWKISKIIDGKDLFSSAKYIPGSPGLNKFLKAASKHKVPKDQVTQAGRACEAFFEFVRAQAGNRKSFDLMVAGCVQEDRALPDVEHRKGAFLHGSYLWGVSARVHLHTCILKASEKPGFLDAATVRGFVDLSWIRQNVPWRISRMYTRDDAGEERTTFDREPISPPPKGAGNESDLPLFWEFCSHPLPKLRRVTDPRGAITYELVESSVGRGGSLTCIHAERIRGVEPRYRDDRHRDLVICVQPRTPSEVLITDLIVHRDLFGPLSPRLEMLSDLFGDALQIEPFECDRIQMSETLEHLGAGVEILRVPEIPRYQEMIGRAFDRLGWESSDFEVYRLRIPYPLIPTCIFIRQELPRAPKK
jgi:hypothetical protein